MKKKITIEGWVSELTEVGDIISVNTEGKLDFNDADAIYKEMGTSDKWDEEWPPKRCIISIEIVE